VKFSSPGSLIVTNWLVPASVKDIVLAPVGLRCFDCF
jgi:hypothetical protein